MSSGRSRLTAVALGALLLVGVTALGAAPAAADTPTVQIDGVEVTDGHVRFVLTTGHLPSDQPLTAAGVAVEANGMPVAATVTPVAATGTPVPPRAVMVVLDTSGSMGAPGIVAASAAAQSFVAGLPTDVLVGLVTFATGPALLLAPTADRAGFGAALASATSGGNTALYDAVRTAVAALDAAGLGASAQRRVVLLSDGDDTTSTTGLDEAAGLLAAGRVPADVVAFRYEGADAVALRRLADAAGGRVLAAEDAAQLSAVFAAIADTFTQRAVVEFDVPAGLAGVSVELRASVVTGTGTIRTQTPVTFSTGPAASVRPVAGTEAAAPGWQLPAVLGVIFAAVLLVALALAGKVNDGAAGRRLNLQFDRYGPARYAAPHDEPLVTPVAARDGWLDRLLGAGAGAQLVADRLDLAGMTFTVPRWRLLRLGAGLAASIALSVLFGNPLLGVPVGAALGWLVTRGYLGWRIKHRFAAFDDQLPDVLQMVAGSLQSGFSLGQAFNGVTREDNQPAAAEFARALAETRIGVTLEDALDRTAIRMDNADLRWVVMAVRIQREVGGNLAEVLLTTVETMRERARTRRQVKALSAEGKLSGYILVALPIVIGSFLFMTRRDYMRPLYGTPVGLVMLVGAGAMIGIGALWMRQLVKVEV